MTLRHWIGNVLRNIAQIVDPKPPALTWTYRADTGETTVTHWNRTN